MIRAGCVHLTLTALVDAEERQRLLAPGGAATVLARLLPLVQRLPGRRAALQLGSSGPGKAALLAAPAGGPAALLSLVLGEGDAGLAPPEPSLQPPLATTVSACGGFFRLRCPRGLLWGAGGLAALCRRAGSGHVPLALVLAGTAAGEGGGGGGGSSDEEEGGLPSGSEEDEQPELSEEEGEEGAPQDPHELVELDAWVPFGAPPPAPDGAARRDAPVWQAGWGLYEFELSRGERAQAGGRVCLKAVWFAWPCALGPEPHLQWRVHAGRICHHWAPNEPNCTPSPFHAGALLGPAAPVLVLPDAHAAAAAELAGLRPGPQAATLLRLVALALRYLEQREGATGRVASEAFQARYPPLAVARLAAAARQLVALAQRAGWPALAALLRPAAIADGWHPARAALMAAPQAPATATASPAAAPAAPAPRADPMPAAGAAPSPEPRGPHVVASLLTPPAPAPDAHEPPTGSFASPRKPGSSGSSGDGGEAGKAGDAAAPLAPLGPEDGLRRVMHPAVLGATTLAVAGCVLGLGWALVGGYL